MRSPLANLTAVEWRCSPSVLLPKPAVFSLNFLWAKAWARAGKCDQELHAGWPTCQEAHGCCGGFWGSLGSGQAAGGGFGLSGPLLSRDRRTDNPGYVPTL